MEAPDDYYKMSTFEKTLICNGCGPSGKLGTIVPDRIYGVKVSEACNIHDYMYHKGNTEYDRKRADDLFYMNLIEICDNNSSNWFMKFLRRRRCLKYYLAVREFGRSFFNFTKTI